jgi:glycosyltransferase involved in cell wall biosynthesis
MVQLFDYYYHGRKNDLADEAGPETPPAYYHWRRSANAIDLLDLENAVLPWTPTAWQRDLYPPEYRQDFLVLHDGIDARTFRPSKSKPTTIAGRTIPENAKVVTFVAKCLDRLRGFDRFLKLANALAREQPDVIAIAVGDAKVTRGLDVAFHGKNYRDHVTRLDPPPHSDRLWFTGTVTPSSLAEILARSDLHVYPSRSYPVSRSLLQAMASGCIVLATDDAPVREVIRDGVDGKLATADDPDDWFHQASKILDNPAAYSPMKTSAHHVVLERFDRDATLPKLAERLNQLAGLGG